MDAINTAIVIREEDIGSGALTSLLASLESWSTAISLVILAEETSPRWLTLPAGLVDAIWFDRRNANDDPARMASSLLLALADFSHLLFLEGRELRPLAARLAALRDCDLIADVSHILSPNSCQRLVFAGQALLTVRSLAAKHVWTLRRQAFDCASPEGETRRYAIVSCPVAASEEMAVKSVRHYCVTTRPRLSRAEIIVGGGRGVGKQQLALLREIADKLGAALGGTRALVDAGYFTEQDQIGQTGENISPRVYLACGISGAIQHVAGITNSNIIIAINSDPQASIIKHYADHYLLGDLSEVLPHLLAQL
ncbi:TPA: electron transfer flavoprotein subunit alpha/FixB family protein [Raoultella ornithinolytica]|nr:electron transfer flavoprotein subunit alpha/FixB family protein [Raoultella ornithinolytica]